MKRITRLTIPALALVAGCAGEYSYATPSGAVTYTTGADYYEEAPPPNIETYPYYDYQGGYLYNVDGRYYGRRNNRWYRYRERPRDLDERYYHQRHEEHEEHEHEHEHH